MNSSQTPEPIYILGAGPAGLAAAYHLTKQGQPIVVVERDARVGGLAKSFEYKGFILDYGPHRFFTKIPPVLKLWNEVLGNDQVTVNRLTRIYYGGKYFSYPLKAFEALLTLGIVESARIMTSYLNVRAFPNHKPKNFAEWVTNNFGKRLFEIFFQAYTEKLWGIPCTAISADWAAQRIKGLSLSKAARNALLGNTGKVKSLIDQFQFPRLGSGQLYDKIQDYLEQHNQSVLLNTEVVQVHHDGTDITHITLRDRNTKIKQIVPCGGVISSIPLTRLVQQMDSPPPDQVVAATESLKFRNTILVYLIVEGEKLFPDNWLYINEPSVQVGRVTNFANWSSEMLPNSHQTPLCCEYWCNTDEPMWTEDEDQLVLQAERELRKIGLLRHEKVSDGFVVRLPQTYPIYAGQYKEALTEIQSYLSRFENLQLIGRYGAFKYNNQDHSLLMGVMAAENVLLPGKHDLWAVNSDSEYQEEASNTTAVAPVRTRRRSSSRGRVAQVFQQFAGYLFTGGSATVVDLLVFSFLIASGLWYLPSMCISYSIGLVVNFLLTRQLVFGVYWNNWMVQFAVFTSVALNSFLAHLGLMQLLINQAQWQPTLARLASSACVALLSFVGHKLYSFSSNTQTQASVHRGFKA